MSAAVNTLSRMTTVTLQFSRPDPSAEGFMDRVVSAAVETRIEGDASLAQGAGA